MVDIVMGFVLLLALGGGGWFAWQRFGGSAGALFGGGREARIGVTEVASVDGKRKLVLIHRDGVEHLIMTGGPIDVVIEQGILPQRRPAVAVAPQTMPGQTIEPRFAAQHVHPQAEPPPDQASGFGRLRQRPASVGAEPLPRDSGASLVIGGGVR